MFNDIRLKRVSNTYMSVRLIPISTPLFLVGTGLPRPRSFPSLISLTSSLSYTSPLTRVLGAHFPISLSQSAPPAVPSTALCNPAPDLARRDRKRSLKLPWDGRTEDQRPYRVVRDAGDSR